MDRSEEILALRAGLTKLREQADELSRRLEKLENEEKGNAIRSPREQPAEPQGPSALSQAAARPTDPAQPLVPPRPVRQPEPIANASAAQEAEQKQDDGGLAVIGQLKERVAAKTEGMNWEMALGTYWLPRIGIVVTGIALVLLMSLAVQRMADNPYAPHFRIAIGYLTCATLLVVGARLEDRYTGYARVLLAGGIGLSYFVTFATHYIERSRIIDRVEPTLLLLAVVVMSWACVAQWRRSPVLASIASGLGQATILLASLTIPEPGPYVPAGILLLAAGSAFFLLRNGWYTVSAIGMVGAYANQLVWMWKAPRSSWPAGFIFVMTILGIYLLIFALAELFAPDALRRRKLPLWLRNAYVSTNSAGAVILGTLVMHAYTQVRDHIDWLYFVVATLFTLLALAYLRLRKRDPLFNTYIIKAVTLLTLGLAIRYEGSGLTTWLAIEALVLLISAQRSGLVVTRVLAFTVAALAVLSGFLAARQLPVVTVADVAQLGEYVRYGFSVLALLLAALVYARTDWQRRSPDGAHLPSDFQDFFWYLDLVKRPSTGMCNPQKPCQGDLFPHLYSLAILPVLIPAGHQLFGEGHVTFGFLACALVLTVAARLAKLRSYGLVSCILFGWALCTALIEVAGDPILPRWAFLSGVPSRNVSLASLSFAGLIALASEPFALLKGTGLACHRGRGVPYLLYAGVAWLTGLYLVEYHEPAIAVAELLVAAIVGACLTGLLHRGPLSVASVFLLAWSHCLLLYKGPENLAYWHVIAWACVGTGLSVERIVVTRALPKLSSWLASISLISTWIVLLAYLNEEVAVAWKPAAFGAACIAYLGYGALFRTRAAMALGVLTALAISLAMIGDRLSMASAGTVLAGHGIPVIFWILCERLVSLAATRSGKTSAGNLAGIPVVILVILTLLMCYRVPQLTESLVSMSWTGCAVVLFGIALVFKQRFYRYAGLAVFLAILVRVALVDTRELAAIPRILTCMVLGLVLLGVSYGYAKAAILFGRGQSGNTG